MEFQLSPTSADRCFMHSLDGRVWKSNLSETSQDQKVAELRYVSKIRGLNVHSPCFLRTDSRLFFRAIKNRIRAKDLRVHLGRLGLGRHAHTPQDRDSLHRLAQKSQKEFQLRLRQRRRSSKSSRRDALFPQPEEVQTPKPKEADGYRGFHKKVG